MIYGKDFWVVEREVNGSRTLFYRGQGAVTTEIEKAFQYGTRELAEEFINRVEHFSDFSPALYETIYRKVDTGHEENI